MKLTLTSLLILLPALFACRGATILAGKHSHENGFIGKASVFDGELTNVPELLRAVGHQTAVVGKWHLGSDPSRSST